MTTDNDSIRSKTENGAESTAPKEEPKATDAAPEVAAEPAVASELETARAERDKFREQLLRTAAELENSRKRGKRDLEDARMRSKSDVIAELLPVFDNLERALATAGSASDLGSVVEGVRMVLKLFQDTAERMGLKRVPTVGERFDPAIHDAIQQKETDEHPPGTVINEVAPGYRFGERLVRPAMVIVARKPPAKPVAAAAGPAPAAADATGNGPAASEQSSKDSKDADKTT